MSSKQYKQVYFVDTEFSQPDGAAILYLADAGMHSCTNKDDIAMNPSIKGLQKILQGDVIYYFPRNGPFQEQTPSQLNTLENTLSDVLEFIKINMIMRNYKKIVVLGFGPYGKLAQEIKYSYPNLVSSAINIEYMHIDKFNTLLQDESLSPAQKFNLYTNMQRLDLSNLNLTNQRSKQQFMVQNQDYLDESSSDTEIFCQVFGNIYKLAEFDTLCKLQQYTSIQKLLGEEEKKDSDFFGIQGKSGELGILKGQSLNYTGTFCGDQLGIQFDSQEIGKRVLRLLENLQNI